MPVTRVLLIDDDDRLADMLGQYLRTRGFEVEHRADASSGLRTAQDKRFDVLVLDVMLPDFDGFEVLRRLRAKSDVPVLMLTARGEDTDRIVGLELGADDYLPKPFNPRELVARIQAILRRGRTSSPGEDASVLTFGRLEIDRAAREARLEGKVCAPVRAAARTGRALRARAVTGAAHAGGAR